MRPPERIDEILELIGGIWKKNSDLRFMQLLNILQQECSDSQNGLGKVIKADEDGFERVGFDLFNFEDDALTELLKQRDSNETIGRIP